MIISKDEESPPEASPAPELKLNEILQSTSTTLSQPSTQSKLYTTFVRNQKRLLTLLLGLATITSPLTATIYFPLLPLLSNYFHASLQSINVTLTVYIIFQALSPAIFGPLSDSLGRRPVYLLTLSLYAVANLGLALNKHSYSALIGLRALQSLGASAAFAVSYGVVADVCVPSERGRMLGPVSMALNLGACIGPVIGGWIAYKSGSFEWIFWILVIVGTILLLGVAALLPETARSVVGDGAGRKRGNCWEESWYSICKHWFQKQNETQNEDQDLREAKSERNNLNDNLSRDFVFEILLRVFESFSTSILSWFYGCMGPFTQLIIPSLLQYPIYTSQFTISTSFKSAWHTCHGESASSSAGIAWEN
jgi:multidrug resistance protein